MRLNQQQKNAFEQHLSQFWRNRNCEICNNNQWSPDEHVFELRLLQEGKAKPLIAMTCNNCGNVKTFNAIQIGVLSSDDLEDTEENDE